MLLYPVATHVEFDGGFSHLELRTVTETYTEQVPYMTMETYSCGSGTSFRTCTRSATQYRTEYRTRTVTRYEPVSDGSCSEALWIAPEVNHVYLVDFTYRDRNVCSATCVEQVAGGAEGQFTNRACPQPTRAQIEAQSQ
jgi:hypothetical protein